MAYKLKSGTESQLQIAIMQWSLLNSTRLPELEFLYHPANGGHRHIAVASKLKKEGVKRGVPDLQLDVARKGYHGWRGELKVGKNPRTPSQKRWHEALEQAGYFIDTFRTFEDCVNSLEWYLGGRK